VRDALHVQRRRADTAARTFIGIIHADCRASAMTSAVIAASEDIERAMFR
jgi:hypothetical protein